jgi:hypothetical protein
MAGTSFLLTVIVKICYGPNQWTPGTISAGLKRLGRKVEPSPPLCVHVMNVGATTISFHGVVLNELSTRKNLPAHIRMK